MSYRDTIDVHEKQLHERLALNSYSTLLPANAMSTTPICFKCRMRANVFVPILQELAASSTDAKRPQNYYYTYHSRLKLPVHELEKKLEE